MTRVEGGTSAEVQAPPTDQPAIEERANPSNLMRSHQRLTKATPTFPSRVAYSRARGPSVHNHAMLRYQEVRAAITGDLTIIINVFIVLHK